MKLSFAPSAVRDLRRHRQFIAKDNPAAAARISQQLKKTNHGVVGPSEDGPPGGGTAECSRDRFKGLCVPVSFARQNDQGVTYLAWSRRSLEKKGSS